MKSHFGKFHLLLWGVCPAGSSITIPRNDYSNSMNQQLPLGDGAVRIDLPANAFQSFRLFITRQLISGKGEPNWNNPTWRMNVLSGNFVWFNETRQKREQKGEAVSDPGDVATREIAQNTVNEFRHFFASTFCTCSAKSKHHHAWQDLENSLWPWSKSQLQVHAMHRKTK